MNQSLPKVFISYSWENDTHKELIKNFSDNLKLKDINSIIDADIPLTPEGGWIRWMKKQIIEADYVILIFTQTYFNCFTGNVEPTEGHGVQWESRIVFSEIYSGVNIAKYIPVVINDADLQDCIPNELDCSRFNLNTQFNDLWSAIRDDWEVNHIIKKTREPYKFIIDYVKNKNISKDDLLLSCKKFLDSSSFVSLQKQDNIEKIITYIYENEKSFCIINDLFDNDNDEIAGWLNNKLTNCQEIEHNEEPRVIIIFKSKNNGKIYNVNIIYKDIYSHGSGNDDEDYNLSNFSSKNELIKKMMSYAIGNPKVDLILPPELMTEDINLWKVEENKTLSKLAQYNIRDIGRYSSDENLREQVIKKQWEKVLEKIHNNKSLCCVTQESALGDFRDKTQGSGVGDIGNGMEESGISSKFILKESNFKSLLMTDMSYIVLWISRDLDQDFSSLYEDIHVLQEKYFGLQNSPINLMWDDPTTYYYPDEIQGETNE